MKFIDGGPSMKKQQFFLVVILVIFLSILFIISWSNNRFPLPKFEEAELLINDGTNSTKIGELRSYEGIVVKKPYETDHDVIFLTVLNKDLQIGITLFPSMGILNHDFELGDKVRVIGLIDKYKQKIQLRPLSKESIMIVDKHTMDFWTLFPTVELHQVKDYAGGSVIIDPVYIMNVKDIRSSKGKHHIAFEVYDGENKINGIFFDGSWTNNELENIKSYSVPFVKTRICYF